MNLNHTQACPYCDKFKVERQRRTQDDGHYYYINKTYGCTIYEDTSWINRRGGCPMFPYRAVPKSRGEYVDGVIISGKRVGQQHQKRHDRKYENRKSKRKYR